MDNSKTELERLKRSWKVFDKKLKNKDFMSKKEILQLIEKKRVKTTGLVSSLNKSNIQIIIFSLILLVTLLLTDKNPRLYPDEIYRTVYIVLPVFLLWNVFTIIYLSKIRLDTMDIATVVKRINIYKLFAICEGIVAGIIFFVLAYMYFVHERVWFFELKYQVYITSIWGAGMVFLVWLINKLVFKRIARINKNLRELKELKRRL